MKAKTIALILIPLNILLAYFVYNSIDSEVKFTKEQKPIVQMLERKNNEQRRIGI